ncbi:MAG: pyridoxamine 5'-phosphate oxidase [Alphaproteobacteria bacterium]
MTDQPHDPFSLFQHLFDQARRSEPEDPEAMALATADAQGRPSVRMVLLKGVDQGGFVFYTNTDSRKGQDLAANPFAALCIHWKSMRRQIRCEGRIERVSDADADAYFASRPRESRIGAWASQQSRPLKSRLALEKAVARYGLKFGLGEVPRPPYWGGYRLMPDRIEFWTAGAFRLHDRLVYTRADGQWTTVKLYP